MRISSSITPVAAISFLRILKSASAIAIPEPVNNNALTPSHVLASPLGIPIDPRFTVVEGYSTVVPLDQTSCLKISLDYVSELALRDWTSTVPRTMWPSAPQYHAVTIIISPEAPSTQIPVSYLIWGFNVVIQNMFFLHRFFVSSWDLRWKDRKVASIYFRQLVGSRGSAPPAIMKSGRSAEDNGLPSILNQTSKPEALHETEDVTIAAATSPGSQILNEGDVWIALFQAMQAMAFLSAETRFMADLRIVPEATNVKLSITGQRGPGLPRQSPPFLYYSTVIRAIRLVADWLTSDPGKFRDLAIAIFSNGVFVGAGYIEHTSMPDPPLEHLLSNMSISTS
ncbi:MAG: hypothetical protein Q9222_000731 [Ikaeria aurantiellina]